MIDVTSPQPGAVVTYLTDITGSVTDDNLEFYQLQYARAGTDNWVTFHESQVVKGVVDTAIEIRESAVNMVSCQSRWDALGHAI